MLQPKSGEGRASLKGAPDTSRGFFEAIPHLVFRLSLTGIVTASPFTPLMRGELTHRDGHFPGHKARLGLDP